MNESERRRRRRRVFAGPTYGYGGYGYGGLYPGNEDNDRDDLTMVSNLSPDQFGDLGDGGDGGGE